MKSVQLILLSAFVFGFWAKNYFVPSSSPRFPTSEGTNTVHFIKKSTQTSDQLDLALGLISYKSWPREKSDLKSFIQLFDKSTKDKNDFSWMATPIENKSFINFTQPYLGPHHKSLEENIKKYLGTKKKHYLKELDEKLLQQKELKKIIVDELIMTAPESGPLFQYFTINNKGQSLRTLWKSNIDFASGETPKISFSNKISVDTKKWKSYKINPGPITKDFVLEKVSYLEAPKNHYVLGVDLIKRKKSHLILNFAELDQNNYKSSLGIPLSYKDHHSSVIVEGTYKGLNVKFLIKKIHFEALVLKNQMFIEFKPKKSSIPVFAYQYRENIKGSLELLKKGFRCNHQNLKSNLTLLPESFEDKYVCWGYKKDYRELIDSKEIDSLITLIGLKALSIF